MNVPSEINAAAVKNGPAEKVTPMMQQRVLVWGFALNIESYAESYALWIAQQRALALPLW